MTHTQSRLKDWRKRLRPPVKILESTKRPSSKLDILVQSKNICRAYAKARPCQMSFITRERSEKQSECANMFNSFFVSVFNQKDTNFQPNYPRKNLNCFRINQRRVETLLEDLKIGKSSGPDKIGNILLRNAAKGLSKSLTLIFQTIINKGTYPNQWKFGQICPVFKDGDQKDVTCYRPISLLSCISKVLERIIFDEIYPLVKKNCTRSSLVSERRGQPPSNYFCSWTGYTNTMTTMR